MSQVARSGLLGTDDKGEPDVPSPALVTISWPLLAALSICLANARCCSIMCSAKSNTASRTSSGLPGALVVGWRPACGVPEVGLSP